MSRGEEIAVILSYIPYGVVMGKIFANPLSALVSYLFMAYMGVYLVRAGKKEMRYYVVLGLLGFLVALVTSLASKAFLPK